MRAMLVVATTAVVVGLGACRADRDAAEPVDMRTDPRIEAAPAMPTPPGEVPTGLLPDTGQQPAAGPGAMPQDTVQPMGPGTPGAQPTRP